MTPLRVLYHHRIRADDGQAVHVRELIGALRGAGHIVHECALVPKATQHVAGPAAVATPFPVAKGGGLWRRLRLPRTAVEILEVLYNRRGLRMLRTAARDCRPDVIYERHALHCHAGLDAARELGLPLLLEVNSPMVDEMQQLGLLRFPGTATRTERRVLAGADAVLAVTGVLRQLLIARGARPERVHVIPNGVDLERYQPAALATAAAAVRQRLALPPDAFALGFVGYMRPWHRLDLVLEVMARPACRRLHLVLIGRGPALEPLRQQATAMGLGARLHAVGEVAPELVPAHVRALDGALIPAINPYASPLKLFDSLAAGVPTIAPDQPNLRELVEDGEHALLFAPGSAPALAARVEALLQQRDLGPRLGAAGRQRLLQQDWTWAGNARRVVAIARRLRGEEA